MNGSRNFNLATLGGNKMHANQNRKITHLQWGIFVACWLGGIFAGMNSTLFSVLLPAAIQDLAESADRAIISQIGSLILCMFLLGWMFGGVIGGIFADRFGRVRAMSVAIGLYAVFTSLAGFVQDPWQLAACRFFTGLGVGAEMVCISIVLAESWPERSPALAVGALITSYQIGVFLSGVVGSLVYSWRMAYACCIIPLFLALIIALWMPESKKWIKAQPRDEKKSAVKSTSQWSQFFSLFRSEGWNLLIGSTMFGGLLIGYWASLSWVPTWIQDLLKNGGSGQEANLATVYHGLAAVFGCLISGALANAFGRLTVVFLAFTGAFLTSGWMFLGNTAFSNLIYWQHSMLGFIAGMAQAVMYIYLPELFPTCIRATASGLCLNIGRIITAIVVICVGFLVPLFGGYAKALFAFSCLYLLGAAAALAAKETKAVLLE